MAKQKFSTTLLQAKKTATGIEIPAEIIDALAAGKKPPIRVTINGKYTYRSTVAVMGGKYMVGVSAEHRAGAGVNGGDNINVELELDTEQREISLHPEFEAALKKNAAAQKVFSTLSNSNKQRHTLPIEQAKTDETRQRRIEKSVSMLEQGIKG
jgi:hypothetical protein